MMKALLVLILVAFSITDAEARRYRGGYNGYYRYHHYRSYHRHNRDTDRNADRSQTSKERHSDEAYGELGRERSIRELGSQEPIAFQYAIGNSISNQLSGAWPWEYEKALHYDNMCY